MSAMNGKNIAKKFWDREKYPDYGHIKQRRLLELNWLLPRLSGKTLLDVGCGDGSLGNCLLELTDLKITGCDFSEKMMHSARFPTFVYDAYSGAALPVADQTIIAGVIQYLFEDKAVVSLLEAVKSPVLFLRTACTLKDQTEVVNHHSEKLGEEYSSRYLTLEKTLELVNKVFRVEDVVRIYPDSLESAFGTKQFYIKGRKR